MLPRLRQPGWRALTPGSSVPRIHLDPNDLGGGRAGATWLLRPPERGGARRLCCRNPPGTTPATCSPSSTGWTRTVSAELLPAPLELAAEDPGAVAFIWADWQSCAADKAQLLDPGARAVQGGVRRRPLLLPRARPSAAASTSGSTRTSRSPAACTRGIPRSSARSTDPPASVRRRPRRSRPAAQFGATLAAGDRRLAEARDHAARERPSQRLRQRPSDGAQPVRAGPSRPVAVPARRDHRDRRRRAPRAVRPGPAPGRQVRSVPGRRPRNSTGSTPEEIIGGYYRQVGVVWDGGRLAARQPGRGRSYRRRSHGETVTGDA